MTYDKLINLIDRVVGTKGIFRAPAWWVNKLFKSTAECAVETANSIVTKCRPLVKTADLASSHQTLFSGYLYKGKVPFTTIDFYIPKDDIFDETYAEFMLGSSDDVSYKISGDDELGGLIWAQKAPEQKNTEYRLTVLGGTAWSVSRNLNHLHIKYNIEDISAPTKMFNKTGVVALFMIDGVPTTMTEEHQFTEPGIHIVDIYDTSLAFNKVLNGISTIVDVKVETYGAIGSDIESLFEGTSIRTANFTEYRYKHQSVWYGQTFENCTNLDERYFNADLRNMAFTVTGRMYNMFNGTTLKTIDLSTWSLKGATGLAGDEGTIFPATLKTLIVNSPEDLSGDVGLQLPSDVNVIYASTRAPYAVFYNPNGTVYRELTEEELTELPEVPALDGYTAVCWNLTLDEIKNRLNLYGHCEVGAVYSTPTSIAKVTIPEGKLVGEIRFGRGNEDFSATIDWGDGSEPQTITLTEGSAVNFKHQYESADEYEIQITHISGTCHNNGFRVYADTETTDDYTSVELSFSVVGTGFISVSQIDETAFPIVGTDISNCGYYFSEKLSYLSIPSGIERMEYGEMSKGTVDYDLLNIVLPESIKSIGANYFRRAKYLQGIIFPTTLTTIGNSAFESCFSMRKVVFPPALTTIGSKAFADCFRCSIYDFSKVNQIPDIAEDAFPPLTEDYKILVSSDLYDDFKYKYITAPWSSRIIKK